MRQTRSFLVALTGVLRCHAFAPVPLIRTGQETQFAATQSSRSRSMRLFSIEETQKKDDEIEKLRSMAAKYRAEAAQLEAQKANEIADAAERAFRKFDTNKDGQVSFQELKDGLEKSLKVELPDKRVQKLMDDFDKSGDGVLQPDEFVSIERFRSKLEALARDEKTQALQMTNAAKQEEELSKFLQAQLEMFNDGPATTTDRILSTLPYLFPLLDGLQFARFLVIENPDNPAAQLITILYALYRSIPLGGFIAFFALSFLSGNVRLNRLIRFNMQQAIFIDIALFFPGLLAALYGLIGQQVGFALPPSVTELGSNALFFSLLAVIGYCMVSSLLGITPDKLPLISDAVNARTPTVDMFDEQGRFRNRNEKKEDSDDKK